MPACLLKSFLFLDTETTGLSGGSGTFTFLIGAGRFIGSEFVVEQFFLRGLEEEPAQLHAFEEFLAPCQAIVTFNGKSFDIPLLQTRFLMQGWQPPFGELFHIDLLHLSRKLWRNRLPSRTLGNLEIQILDADRTEEDVPGWQIPSLYSLYLLDGDANRLKPVFYHNKMDVVSLAVLLDHIACLLSDPIAGAGAYGADLIATARLFEQIGDIDVATNLYFHALQHEDAVENRIPREVLLDALTRLAYIHKRQADFDSAVIIWEQAAVLQHLAAHVELAKYYEHQLQDIPTAIEWTHSAIQLLEEPNFTHRSASPNSNFSQHQIRTELDRRLNPTTKKIHRKGMSSYIQKNLKFNMTVNILDGAFFGLAIGFSSFVTVLPLFINTMTQSALLIGLIPAIHAAGWQFPQLFFSRHVSRQSRYKPMTLFLTIQERIPFLGLALIAWFIPVLGIEDCLGPVIFNDHLAEPGCRSDRRRLAKL